MPRIFLFYCENNKITFIFMFKGRVPSPLPPSALVFGPCIRIFYPSPNPPPPVFVSMFYPHFVGTIWEDTNIKVCNFSLVWANLFFLGRWCNTHPTPCHPNPWFTPMGKFDETLWDKSNNANDIIKFLRFSELFLGMDGCSRMGSCIYRGNQWPPSHIWVVILNYIRGITRF